LALDRGKSLSRDSFGPTLDVCDDAYPLPLRGADRDCDTATLA
jgi:hypothetical protein